MNLVVFLSVFTLFLPSLSFAAEGTEVASPGQPLDLTQHWAGYLALIVFAVAYILAMTEEVTELKKSKPMVFAASLIWIFIAAFYTRDGLSEQAGVAFRSTLEGYGELFLFIMVSMTYLNAMEDRGVFDSLRVWLLSKNFTYRQLFWITGFQSFFISSGCNNLTTALLMGSVILAMGKGSPRFVTLSCINVVVASNAGGSFSPFRRYHHVVGMAKRCSTVYRFLFPVDSSHHQLRYTRSHHAFLYSERKTRRGNGSSGYEAGRLDDHLFVRIDHYYVGLLRKLPEPATRRRHDAGIDLFEVFQLLPAKNPRFPSSIDTSGFDRCQN